MDERDPVTEELLQLIRGVYVEMPNLSLAPAQMQWMWGMDDRECGAVLAALVRDQFLYQTADGHYVRPFVPVHRQRCFAHGGFKGHAALTAIASVVYLAVASAQPALAAGQLGASGDARTTLAIRYEEGKGTDVRLDGTTASPRTRSSA